MNYSTLCHYAFDRSRLVIYIWCISFSQPSVLTFPGEQLWLYVVIVSALLEKCTLGLARIHLLVIVQDRQSQTSLLLNITVNS